MKSLLPSTLFVAVIVAASSLAHASFQVGQVFVGRCYGDIDVFDPTSGGLVETLNVALPGQNQPYVCTYGITFDSAGNVYAVTFDQHKGFVVKLDNTGRPLGTFGSGYGYPNSILHDQAGNFYVGQVIGPILKFSPSGVLVASYTPAHDPYGQNPGAEIALKADQRTLLYTAWGCEVKSFDVITKTQGRDYVYNCPAPGSGATQVAALRVLPDASLIVLSDTRAYGVNGLMGARWGSPCAGCFPYQLVSPRIYNPGAYFPSELKLGLDPDGVSFWTYDVSSGYLYKFNVASRSFANPLYVGAANPIAIYGDGMNSTTSFTPILKFASQKVGTKSPPLRASIKNTGLIEMVVSSLNITGDFRITTDYCTVGIRPGTHCDIYVAFTPTRTGLRQGKLRVSDNATGSPQVIALSGQGY